MPGDPRPLESARSRGARWAEVGGGGRSSPRGPPGWSRRAQDSPPAAAFRHRPLAAPQKRGLVWGRWLAVPRPLVSCDIFFEKEGPGFVVRRRRSGGRTPEPRVPGRVAHAVWDAVGRPRLLGISGSKLLKTLKHHFFTLRVAGMSKCP